MSKQGRLQWQLSIARREAEQADRAWRSALDLVAVPADDDEIRSAAQRIEALWQVRERARLRVARLERAMQRSGVERLSHLRTGASFLRWHARTRADRSRMAL